MSSVEWRFFRMVHTPSHGRDHVDLNQQWPEVVVRQQTIKGLAGWLHPAFDLLSPLGCSIYPKFSARRHQVASIVTLSLRIRCLSGCTHFSN